MKRSRYFFIFLFALLAISLITIIDISWITSQEEPVKDIEPLESVPSIPKEEGVFKRSEFSPEYANMPEDPEHERNLEEYYDNRAYDGAPPIIPHPLISEKGIGGKTCLQCHENGGYVKQFEAYAPVTPHPELLNCRQCHVPAKTDVLFKETNFEAKEEPGIQNAAMPGSPPTIPHSLQMRSNCLACHAGPAAPKEIRVSHPLRINCRQCHVPTTDMSTLEWEPEGQNDIEKIKAHVNE